MKHIWSVGFKVLGTGENVNVNVAANHRNAAVEIACKLKEYTEDVDVRVTCTIEGLEVHG